MAEPVRVGRVDEFPEGEMQVRSLASGEIGVVQVQGQFYAFDNTCTHQGVKLAEGYGELRGRRVTCVLHDSSFDLRNGRVTGGPAYDALPTFEVTIDGSDVLVGEAR